MLPQGSPALHLRTDREKNIGNGERSSYEALVRLSGAYTAPPFGEGPWEIPNM